MLTGEGATVDISVWSAAEVAMTMVCIGIPICRPLYRKHLDKFIYANEEPRHHEPMQLRTIGGTIMVRTENPGPTVSRGGSTTLAGSGDSGDGISPGRYKAGHDASWPQKPLNTTLRAGDEEAGGL